ncbi:HIT domain-containing protein [Streptomyces alkaliphilus]|uniref:HIT domain-containing protein n=1 Tax=Streptomyces alkaliphilus TaxID=1472722 RepID=A0A7W3TBU7_9ACTN|nr:HIT family protein [Streptomyces alkaliphilus]MBB0243872.1 HIT domain-containing protein [Streptomyces alkaliphilus]
MTTNLPAHRHTHPKGPRPSVPNCPFCAIVAGRAPATVMRTWSDAIAIVPLNPVTPGHWLVIPRTHVPDAATDPGVSAAVMRRAAEVIAHTGDDCNLITSIGAPATQTVFHLHLHIVPRATGDGLPLPWTPQQATGTEMTAR